MKNMNPEVSTFLDELNHPFRNEIEQLRHCILASNSDLTENIKWNGPNYCHNNNDRITMRVMPPKKQVQLIFHRGTKKLEQPKEKLIEDSSGILVWKENDRAIATFKSMEEIEKSKASLDEIVKNWLINTL
jgi:uncharacterized protein YdeI (YjbR/CyaY-like superfamily)